MATTPRSRAGRAVDYPTSDGKPMAETEHHRKLMNDLIETLEARYVDDPLAHAGGNLLLFYEEGNRRKHISPDVFVTFGIDKQLRLYYLMWLEGKGPDVVFELTSKTTRREDLTTKKELYRDVLKVREYFLFDPYEDYLRPSMQGFRLVDGEYEPIAFEANRLPSDTLGVWLERAGVDLRLVDRETGQRLPTTREVVAQTQSHRDQAEASADAERERTAALQAEVDRLRRELEALRQGNGG